MARRRKMLGEILIGWNIVTANQLNDALAYAKTNHKRIGEALVELEFCSEEDVTKALATQFGLEFVDLDRNAAVSAAIELIPQDLITKHRVLPLEKDGNKIRVIVSDPLDIELLDMLRFRLNMEVECALAPRSKIQRYIDTFLSHSTKDTMDEAIKEIDREGDLLNKENEALLKAQEEGEAPVIKLINMLISEAVRTRASDIHVEGMADRVRIRYRVDGVCAVRDNLPKSMQGPVCARLKIMAGIDIAEKRMPQDGRIKMRIGGSQIDFRVSTAPAYHGESIVLRILRPDSVKVGITGLGFEQDDYERFQKIIRQPNGIFLVTGPTGSGKTTTLYAALQELNRPDRKIITAEDPVEYNFAGINQCQVREDIGLTFPKILRSMLRQAPNISLVGEIRDREVGEVAIQAALTGHLVFSTLHTNDSVSAITRLEDLGVPPYLIGATVIGVLAQRLVRTLCTSCKQPDDALSRDDLSEFVKPWRLTGGVKPYKPVGCLECRMTGYRGRAGLYELLTVGEDERQCISPTTDVARLRKHALHGGLRPLRVAGAMKVAEGLTTLEEVLRATPAWQ